MPVIAIANPKGGSGKSTCALVLGLTLAAKGAKVTVLDADPNQPLVTWHGGAARPLTVTGGLTDETFVPRLDEAATTHDAVIIDLEGTASRIVSRAIMRAHLVLIPMQASAIDAAQAGRAIGLVRQEEIIMRRPISARVVLTRTSPAIATRAERKIAAAMRGRGILALSTALHERSAFKALFEYRTTLAQLDPAEVNGLPAALANAEAFADDVTALLRSLTGKEAA
jgi:chromosome partitioning protein